MKLFIPRFGQCLKLTKQWEFDLYYEHRNASLLELNGVNLKGMHWEDTYEPQAPGEAVFERKYKHIRVAVAMDTVLRVDRLYVRQHDGKASDYDSMSFRVVGSGKGAWGDKVRFWAKLEDCNEIECELVGDPKTKSSAKASPNVTDDVQAGDVIRYDYVAGKALCPGHPITHAICKRQMLVLGKTDDGTYHNVFFSTGDFGYAPVAKIYVVEKRQVDVKDWVHTHQVYRFRSETWAPAEREKLKELSGKWVDAVMARHESTARDLSYKIERLYTETHNRLVRANMNRGI